MADRSRTKVIKFFAVTALVVWIVACSPPEQDVFDTPRIKEPGTRVGLQYTIRSSDGAEVASNIGSEPLEFTMGRNELFPALEAALVGLTIGDERNVELTAEQAYGPRDEDAVREVALDLVPKESRVVGTVLLAEDDSGGQREVTVREISDEMVVLDLNHPLAGEALSIDIRILTVRPPESED